MPAARVVCALVVALIAAAFPVGSDASCVNVDAYGYGVAAQDPGLFVVHPSHPLFHVVATGIARVLGAAGVPAPGHVAVRVVSALGAWFVLALVMKSAPGGLGAWFVLPVLASRMFIIETGVGENLYPAFAAGLLLLREASSDRASPKRLAGLMVLALLMRQDNILLLPGALWAARRALPPGARLKPLAGAVAAAGALTLAAYVVAWRASAGFRDVTFPAYLRSYGGVFELGRTFPARLLEYGAQFGASTAGRISASPWPNVGVGLAAIAGVVGAAALLGARRPATSFAAAVLVTLPIQIVFYVGYQPTNPEWAAHPFLLIVAAAASVADAGAAGPRRALAGKAVLALAAAGMLASHLPATLRLRDGTLVRHVRSVAAAAPDAFFAPDAFRLDVACDVAGVPHEAVGADDPASLIALAARHSATAFVFDRTVLEGEPVNVPQCSKLCEYADACPGYPEITVLRERGLAVAMIVRTRAAPASRPADGR